jgi:hypothetical protein
MPETCFSYSSDVPLGIMNRGAAQQAPGDLLWRPAGKGYPCFSCSSSAPLGIRNRGPAQEAGSDLPRRPAGKPYTCFSTRHRSSRNPKTA